MVGTSQTSGDACEPILQQNPDRFCMFPIKYTAVWEMYKKAEASFWTGALQSDMVTSHQNSLSASKQHAVSCDMCTPQSSAAEYLAQLN